MRLACILLAASALVSTTPAGQPREILKIRSTPYIVMGPLYIAQTDGYFAREGLEMEVVDMAAGSTLVPALVRGDIDVLPMEVTPAIFNAIARGGRLRVVASQLQYGAGCTNSALVVTQGTSASGILNDAARLRGRSFSVGANLVVRYILDESLKPLGLTSDDLTAVEVPDSARVEALRAGRLDLALLSEPNLSRTLAQSGFVMWKRASDVLPRFQYAVILFGPSLLDRRPGVGERFMRAYLRGVGQFLQGKTAHNLDLLETFLHLDRETLTRMCWAPMTPDARPNADSLMAFQRWLMARNAVDRPLKPEALIDTRFLDAR